MIGYWQFAVQYGDGEPHICEGTDGIETGEEEARACAEGNANVRASFPDYPTARVVKRTRTLGLVECDVTLDEKQEVERIVNEKIKEHLPMIRSTMPREEAEKLNAQHEFGAKYPDTVSVYSLGPVGATLENPQY